MVPHTPVYRRRGAALGRCTGWLWCDANTSQAHGADKCLRGGIARIDGQRSKTHKRDDLARDGASSLDRGDVSFREPWACGSAYIMH